MRCWNLFGQIISQIPIPLFIERYFCNYFCGLNIPRSFRRELIEVTKVKSRTSCPGQNPLCCLFLCCLSPFLSPFLFPVLCMSLVLEIRLDSAPASYHIPYFSLLRVCHARWPSVVYSRVPIKCLGGWKGQLSFIWKTKDLSELGKLDNIMATFWWSTCSASATERDIYIWRLDARLWKVFLSVAPDFIKNIQGFNSSFHNHPTTDHKALIQASPDCSISSSYPVIPSHLLEKA